MARNLFKHDPVIGYRFVPNLKGRVRHEGGGYLVRSNADGFRSDRPFVRQASERQKRVLFFGDSNTAGDGVSNGKRFVDVIEKHLDISAYNYGLPSSGVDQQYLAWREAGRDVEHDLLVLCPMVDNIRRNLQSARLIHSSMSGDLVMLPKPYYELKDGTLQLRNSPVPKGHLPAPEEDASEDAAPSGLRTIARKAMGMADKQFPGIRSWSQRARRLALPEAYNDPNSEGWTLMSAILRKWISEAKSPVILCPIPMFDHISGKFRAEPYRQRFAELADETGVEFVDILDGLRKIDATGDAPLRFPHDEHPTVAGHVAIAAQMVPAIDRYLSPTQSKNAASKS